MKKLSILGLLIFVFLYSCKEDIDDPVVVDPPVSDVFENYMPQVENVNATVSGFITDTNGDAVPDAEVRLKNLSVNSDQNGHFAFENSTLNSLGAVVRVEKNGYFKGSRRFYPTSGKETIIKIQLVELSYDQSFDANQGGAINVATGLTVDFDASSIVDATGNVYTGNVHVASTYLDPTAASTYERMPGALQGVDEDSEEVSLLTYGMLALEMQGDQGQDLNIADSHKATISMKIPDELLANAPETMPLWSYSEVHGIWGLESEGVKQGDKYVGDVSHFSYWNYDWPVDNSVSIDFTLVDDNGNPLGNTSFIIQNNEVGSGFGFTNEDGYASGNVPAGLSLSLLINNNSCVDFEAVYDFGPLDIDTSLGNIAVASPNLVTTSISGSLVDCDGNVLENAYLRITDPTNAYSFVYIEGGTFEYSAVSCNAEGDDLIVVVGDPATFLESDPITISYGQSNELGTVAACGNEVLPVVNLIVDGISHIINFGTISIEQASPNQPNGSTHLNAISEPNGSQDSLFYQFLVSFSGTESGDYSGPANQILEIVIPSNDPGAFYYLTSPNQEQGFESFIVTQYNDTNVIGSFSGTLTRFNDIGGQDEVEVSGTFNFEN